MVKYGSWLTRKDIEDIFSELIVRAIDLIKIVGDIYCEYIYE